MNSPEPTPDDIDSIINIINNKPITDAMSHINARMMILRNEYLAAPPDLKPAIKSKISDYQKAYLALLDIVDK